MPTTFVNFWPEFKHQDFWLYKLINHNGIDISKNVIVSSVFANPHKIETLLNNNNNVKILLSFENLYNDRRKWMLQYLSDFDLVLSINDLKQYNAIYAPFYLYSDFNKINLYQNKLYQKNKKHLCLLTGNLQPLRLLLIKKFKEKNMQIDLKGDVNNTKINNKLKFISNYYFNICPENSYAEGYCTEKIYDALIAGCCPIYWGDLDHIKDMINMDKVFYINKNCSNIDGVINDCVSLLTKNIDKLYSLSCEPGLDLYKIEKHKKIKLNEIISKIKQL